MKNKKFAEREIKLAKRILETNPNDEIQKNRLSYWSAYLGDFKTAKDNSVSEKSEKIIEQWKT